ncbi:glycosyltransferase [Nannocystis bainbridge]|uniref:Glycosyltransferase n=1 Tax=Nannocystis bainbridge TaxID=2995303 RepID=A0ABT5ED41_9BACT|nr:glycosyltransferase [Nannocystis bainbridge]MDC0722823.1 glycosyltransferase [Nannocystis bainbridge]
MKILIATLGSHGDVQPYVALGQGLQAAGHDVSLCTCEHFTGFIREHGLDYRPMNNDFVDLVASMEGRAALEGMQNLWGTVNRGIRASAPCSPAGVPLVGSAGSGVEVY